MTLSTAGAADGADPSLHSGAAGKAGGRDIAAFSRPVSHGKPS